MRRFAQHILICATLCFSLLACNVHQWPDAADVVEVDLHLEFNETIEPLTTINRASEFSATSYDDYDIRYIIRAYKIKDNGYLYSEPVDYGNDIFINPVASGDRNYDAKIFLPPGKYRIYAWADYVDNDSLSDKFYLTGDFAKVDIARDADGKHIIGNNEYRDAFNGHVDVEVLPVYETDVPPVEGHIEMKRPLAQFEFITDDLDEFVARVLEKKALEAQASGEVLPEEALKPSSVDLNEFRIVIRHMGFMPDLFSLLDHTGGVEGNPIYSTPSVSFESRIQRINQTEASLGFDYVFVNNNESKLKLSVSVYNKNNTLLSSVPDVVIPIKRSKLTTIRGSFMTQSAQGGVGIEPGFEGDIIFPVN